MAKVRLKEPGREMMRTRTPGRRPAKLPRSLLSTLRRERTSFVHAHRGDDFDCTSVATYNVHKCVGLDGRFDPVRTMAVIREIDADLIALQEVDQRFGNRNGLLDLRAIERETGLVPVPVRGMRRTSHGWHGNIVLVRDAIEVRASQITLRGGEPRGALVVDVCLPAGEVRVIAAHLGLLRRSRARQIAAILAAAEPADGRPTLLMGDLNEWRFGSRSSLKLLEPTFGPLHADVATFPSRFPVWSLDRILASPHDLLSRIEVHDTPLARVASDHLPIKAKIAFAPQVLVEQEVAPRVATAA